MFTRAHLRLGALLAFSLSAGAQNQTGEIRFRVTDSSGATVQARGTAGDKRFETGRDGSAVLSNLPFAVYPVSIMKPGFARQRFEIDIRSATPIEKAITLVIQDTGSAVDVVASTPLAGGELDRDQVPAPVQTVIAKDFLNSGAVELGGLLSRRLSGVYINEVQGNPFQPDVNYRGYTASPLLGTPQGLSLYVDGVRMNQPFGDVVSWDLIPRIAIAETTLIPGSNPVFGLNTLGGTISVDTKDGLTAPGGTLTLAGGSWGRKIAELEYGGANRKGWSWYGAANLFFEDGWRVSSPSDVRQFFGKLGWQNGKTAAFLSFSYANNSLTGNGYQDQRLLALDYSSVYTKPDFTGNKSPFVNLTLRHSPRAPLVYAANVYYRLIRTRILNGDLNDDSLDQSVYQPSAADIRALTAAGYIGFPTAGANALNTPFPSYRCIAQALQRDEPGEKCTGLLNRSLTSQQNYGISGQVSWSVKRNQITVGSGFDRRSSSFSQLAQLGYLNSDRTVTGVNAFGDGVTGGNVDGVPYDTRVNLDGRSNTYSVYAADAFSFAPKWSLTLAGRYNRNTIRNYDQFRPAGGPGSLNSNNVFERFNPAAGITYRAHPFATLYFSFSEGSRAPTSTELGCADPSQPCKLPNALAGDPPLRQVTTRTLEAGFRGGTEGGLGWRAGWFRAENHDDLLFVASTATGFGYFKNFGETRRQGMEADVHARVGKLNLGGNYTFLNATYESPEQITAESNSTNTDGLIRISPGNQIPLVPRNLLKAFALWNPTSRASVNLDFLATGRSFARGNENNLSVPDGHYYLGSGLSPGYALFNLGSHFDVNRRIQLFVQIDNLTDRKYYSAALLSSTGFTATGSFIARPFPAVNGEYPLQNVTFYAPGAPRTVWGGVRIHF